MAERPKFDLPSGYSDESAFLKEARERFTEAETYDRDNRDAGWDDLDFLTGDQWDDTVRQAREAQGRPCLSINSLPQFVAQVVGDIRINRPAIKVRPAEDGDKDVAEIRQGLIRAIEQQSKAQSVYSAAGQLQVACGIGNFKLTLDYAGDDSFNQDLAVKIIPDPFAVAWDPMMTDATGKDARYCFEVTDMGREEFERDYPNTSPDELATEGGASGWSEKNVVRVTQYWFIKHTPVELALLDDGSVVAVDKLPKGVKPKRTRKTMKKSVCMYVITGHAILEGPFEYPISRLPIFRVPGWEVPIKGGKTRRFGLIRFAKDAIRLKNYWRSVSAEVLAMAPKAQWLSPATAVEGREQDFRDAHRSGDPLLVYNDGAAIAPQRIDPPMIPAAVLQEAALNTQDIKDVTGLHDASLGVQGNETSGKAIMARDRQGDVATYIYPDNLREAIAECGRVANEFIPIVYDTARTVRILGEDETAKVMRINDPNDPESHDIAVGKYDVVVETGPSYSTKRVEAAESMMAFVQAVPMVGQVAGDLIAKAQDWPLADQIGERLKKTIPAELRKGEDPEEQQEAPDPAQQAQMQAQQQAMQIDMATKQAQARKADADAQKAEAEAMKAMAEVQAMQGGGQNQELQLRVQEMQANLALKREEAAARIEIDREKLANDAQLQQQKMTFDFQLAERRMNMDEQSAARKFELEASVAGHRAAQAEKAQEAKANQPAKAE
jgi:hypothetical protein